MTQQPQQYGPPAGYPQPAPQQYPPAGYPQQYAQPAPQQYGPPPSAQFPPQAPAPVAPPAQQPGLYVPPTELADFENPGGGSGPSHPTEWVKAADLIGHRLVLQVLEHLESVKTKESPDGTPGVICNVFDIDTGRSFRHVMWNGGHLVDPLKAKLGHTIAVRFDPATSGNGRPYPRPETGDEQHRAAASAWLQQGGARAWAHPEQGGPAWLPDAVERFERKRTEFELNRQQDQRGGPGLGAPAQQGPPPGWATPGPGGYVAPQQQPAPQQYAPPAPQQQPAPGYGPAPQYAMQPPAPGSEPQPPVHYPAQQPAQQYAPPAQQPAPAAPPVDPAAQAAAAAIPPEELARLQAQFGQQ